MRTTHRHHGHRGMRSATYPRLREHGSRAAWLGSALMLVLLTTVVLMMHPGTEVRAVAAAGASGGEAYGAELRVLVATPLAHTASPGCRGGENVLSNAGFEAGTDAWYVNGSVAPTSDEVHEGTMAMQLDASADGYMDHRIAPVAPGATYVLSGWGKLSTTGETGTLGVQLNDRNGERLKADEPTPLTFTGTTFEEQRLTFTIPEQAVEMYVYLSKEDGTARFFADDISLSVCQTGATPEATPLPATPTILPLDESTPTPTEQAEEAPSETATAAVPTPDRSGCDPAYPEARTCIPPGPPFDQGCAITAERNFVVLPPDPQRLDRDKDGIGCEPIHR